MIRYEFSDNQYKKNEALKLIGLFTMVIGTIGISFFPQQQLYKIIGSLAFPIFSYCLVNGYFNTSNLKKYIIRLWVFALVSQIPYTLLFDTTKLNVLFTMGLSLFFIDRMSKREYYWIPSLTIIPLMFPMEYGVYGMAITFIFYLFKNKRWKTIIAQLVLIFIMSFVFSSGIYIYSMIGIVLSLFFPKEKIDIKLNRYIFYWAYPLHLIVIFIALVF